MKTARYYYYKHLRKLNRRLGKIKGGVKTMSISELFKKYFIIGIGVILAIVGLLLILSIVGLGFGVSLQPWIAAFVVGLIFLAVGVWLVKGGTLTP